MNDENKTIGKLSVKFDTYIYFLFLVVICLFTPVFSKLYSHDFENYYNFYIGSQKGLLELFYQGLKELCHKLNFSIYGFLLIITILKIFLLFFVIKKSKVSFPLAIFIYLSEFYFLDGITTIRAGLSSVCYLCALYFRNKDKNKKAILFCILASVTHVSGFFSFFCFLINPHKLNKYRWFFIIPLSYLLYVIHFDYNNILSIFTKLPLPENIIQKITIYQKLAKSENSVNVFSIGIILQVFISFFVIQRINKNNSECTIYLKSYILSIFFLIFFSDMGTFGFRLNQYFSISEVIMLPLICKNDKKNKNLITIFIVFYSFFRLIMQYKSKTLFLGD